MEVERQLKPFKESLDTNTKETQALGRWKLGLWSNGSNGPKGYLEIARDEDKKWKDELFAIVKPLADQKQAQDILRQAEANKSSRRSKIQTRWIQVLTIVIAFLALLVGVFTWLESRKVKSGDLENPLQFLQQKSLERPIPTVYAEDKHRHQQALTD